MMVSPDLRVPSPSPEMSRPSIVMVPPVASVILKCQTETVSSPACSHLNMERVRLDLPEPVLPTIPTLWPGLMWRLTPLSTRGSPSLYLIWRLLRLISPLQ